MLEAEQRLGGWGNVLQHRCYVSTPDSIEALRKIVTSSSQPLYIARGSGRSYGDAAVIDDAGVITPSLNKVISFDADKGIIDCEAGVTLREIINTFLPQGWFPAVTPGTSMVTVGGAIAADVHGKNHHNDGSFGRHLSSFQMMLASGEIIRCSRESHPQVFWATLGGMGLTGVIISAKFKLRRVETAYMKVSYQRTGSLDETLELLQNDTTMQYSVAWIDGLATGKALGRAVWMPGRESTLDELPPDFKQHYLTPPLLGRRKAPRWAAAALRPMFMRIFNAAYYARHRKFKEKHVDFRRYFFPLDAIPNWNCLYGGRGFVQYQALFPVQTHREGISTLLKMSARSGRSSFLSVIKRMGLASGGMLSFPHPGYTICLDFPNRPGLQEFLRELDDVVLAHGGRLYLAKDASTSAKAFSQMYPRLAEFQQVQQQVDPGGLFASSQSRRLNITAAD